MLDIKFFILLLLLIILYNLELFFKESINKTRSLVFDVFNVELSKLFNLISKTILLIIYSLLLNIYFLL